jgi:hypothetical protein
MSDWGKFWTTLVLGVSIYFGLMFLLLNWGV